MTKKIDFEFESHFPYIPLFVYRFVTFRHGLSGFHGFNPRELRQLADATGHLQRGSSPHRTVLLLLDVLLAFSRISVGLVLLAVSRISVGLVLPSGGARNIDQEEAGNCLYLVT